MENKAAARKSCIKQIGKVLDTTCRKCIIPPYQINGGLCGDCKVDGVLKELGSELSGFELIQDERERDLHFKKWTEEEIEKFEKLYEDNTVKEIAQIMGRTVSSVKNRVRFTREKAGLVVPREVNNQPTAWTAEDDKKIIEMFKTKTITEIFLEIGRSPSAISNRLQRLRKKGYTVEKDEGLNRARW